MEENDVVTQSNLNSVRDVSRRTARRVISISVLSGLLGGLLLAGLVYLFTNPDQAWLAAACIVIFTGIGSYQAIKWHRHYRCIDKQLDALELRVRGGETIYALQVKFHSRR